jgi:hypothetical protein
MKISVEVNQSGQEIIDILCQYILPSVEEAGAGTRIVIANLQNAEITVVARGSDSIDDVVKSIKLYKMFERIELVSDGASVWYMI